ncbi:MAG: hypothetical protein KF812_01675 [Fimbriimonadaceae bacterium]|nr:hypothetical protein [Fimbriimonadaceae bacterium]
MSRLVALTLVAVAVAGCSKPAPTASRVPVKPDPSVVAPTAEEIYVGTWKADPDRILKDSKGNDVRMSSGLSEFLGKPELILRDDMTFRLSEFKGDNKPGKWKVEGDGIVLKFDGDMPPARYDRADGGDSLRNAELNMLFRREKI